MSRRRRAIVTTAGVILGAALFAYAVSRVGVDALTDGVRRVGWGLVAIVALGGVRFALRAQCWRWCLPRGVTLDFLHALSAFLAGDAVGNVTPLGLLASEPTKVLLVRHHLATFDSVASLTLENILYALSVVAMLAFGLGLLLATTTMPGRAWWVAVTALAAAVVATACVFAFARAPRLLPLRAQLHGLATDRPGRLAQVFSLHLVFHVLAVAETYLILLWLLGDESPTALQAVIFETVNRLTIVVFKFVPFRIGVDEATAGAVAPLLAVTGAVGVTLAVIRKARMLFWSAIGLLLVATHPTRSLPH
jgi:hypothetical protein